MLATSRMESTCKQFHEKAGLDMKNSKSDEKRFKEKKLPLTIFKKSCAVAL